IIEVSASVFGSTTRRHKWRPGKSAFSVAAKLPMSSSSRTSSERWRDSSKAACMTASCDGGVSLRDFGALAFAFALPGLAARLAARVLAGARSAIRRALIQIEDLRRADVGLGLVARDLSDLAHDLRHALRLAQDDVDRAIVHVVGRHL